MVVRKIAKWVGNVILGFLLVVIILKVYSPSIADVFQLRNPLLHEAILDAGAHLNNSEAAFEKAWILRMRLEESLEQLTDSELDEKAEELEQQAYEVRNLMNRAAEQGNEEAKSFLRRFY